MGDPSTWPLCMYDIALLAAVAVENSINASPLCVPTIDRINIRVMPGMKKRKVNIQLTLC